MYNTTALDSKTTLNYKKPISILAIVSLALYVLVFILELYVDFVMNEIHFSDWLEYSFIYSVLPLLPCIIFAIYILKSYKTKKHILIPFVFLSFLLSSLVSVVLNYQYIGLGVWTTVHILLLILASICAFTGFSKKILYIISVSGILLTQAKDLIYNLRFVFEYTTRIYSFTYLASVFSTALLYVALLLLGLKNTFPSMTSSSTKSNQTATQPRFQQPYGNQPYGNQPYSNQPYGNQQFNTQPYNTQPINVKKEDNQVFNGQQCTGQVFDISQFNNDNSNSETSNTDTSGIK